MFIRDGESGERATATMAGSHRKVSGGRGLLCSIGYVTGCVRHGDEGPFFTRRKKVFDVRSEIDSNEGGALVTIGIVSFAFYNVAKSTTDG